MKQNKETTYQRLKRENQELKTKLVTLVSSPDSMEALKIKLEVVRCVDIERAIWQGDTTNANNEGLIKKIAQ